MNDRFMEKYRELEAELKLDGRTVLEYETDLTDPSAQEKLKLCRIARNYMVHNDMDFFKASKAMIDFVNGIAGELRTQREHARDRMTRRKPVTVGAPINSVIPMCSKGPVPVVDHKTGRFLFLIDAEHIVSCLAKGKTRVEKMRKTPSYRYVAKTDLLKGLSGTYIVTSDGTAKGKYLGILTL